MAQDNETQDVGQTAGQPDTDTESAESQQDTEAEGQQEPDPRNAEAAKWRHRAKDAANGLDAAKLLLDAHADQLAAVQRQVVSQHVASTFASADDFHRSTDLADLVDETGAVDLAKVDDAAQRILAANPHYARGRDIPSAVPAAVVTTDTPPTHVPGGAKPSWSDVLNEGKKM